MTLATKVVIYDPIPLRDLYDYCADLIGTPKDIEPLDREFWNGIFSMGNPPGLGLVGWLNVFYNPDGPLCLTDWGREGEECVYIVDIDTAYGFKFENGANCNDLHAAFVRAVGWYLDNRGARWAWINEYSGVLNEHLEGLSDFGNMALGAQALSRQWAV